MTTDFLDILSELQPDRFMKNILYDALCEVYDLYEANGSSEDWFLEYMYSGISVHSFDNKEASIWLRVNQSYHHTIFNCMLHYLHYQYNDIRITEEYKQIVSEIKKKYKEKCDIGISFIELKEDNLFDAVKDNTLKWVKMRMTYVFEELDKIDINTFGKKKKFESMLDEL